MHLVAVIFLTFILISGASSYLFSNITFSPITNTSCNTYLLIKYAEIRYHFIVK